ncbi:MAG: hypothetical protein R3F34_06265 [Planctomycetota bacterium]
MQEKLEERSGSARIELEWISLDGLELGVVLAVGPDEMQSGSIRVLARASGAPVDISLDVPHVQFIADEFGRSPLFAKGGAVSGGGLWRLRVERDPPVVLEEFDLDELRSRHEGDAGPMPSGEIIITLSDLTIAGPVHDDGRERSRTTLEKIQLFARLEAAGTGDRLAIEGAGADDGAAPSR